MPVKNAAARRESLVFAGLLLGGVMGQPTVKLISHAVEHFEQQVTADVATLEKALEQWLEGKEGAQPTLEDVTELRKLLQLKGSGDWESYDGYYTNVYYLAQKRHDTVTVAAATVGELIARLQGLDPTLPIEVVAGEHTGRLNAITSEVSA